MAERLSTGFTDALNAAVVTMMADSVIHIYSGGQPATGDAAETGTLLAIVTLDAAAFVPGVGTNGLNMDLSVSGVLSKAVAETWEALGLAAAGTGMVAGWFRWYANDVTTGISTAAVRVDGAIGTSSAYELQMTNTTIALNSPVAITSFTYTSPKQ